MPITVRLSLASLALFVMPALSSDAGAEPFATFNLSPLIHIYGLPTLGSARVLHHDEQHVALNLEAANHFYNGSNSSELLTLDGETHRAALILRRGAATFEWGIELPYVAHDGGFMDSFIEGWHDTFGMPNGGREHYARDQLSYHYQRHGVDQLRFTQPSRGAGDVRLYAAWPILTEPDGPDVALRAGLKLPTGNSGELRGSGAADLAIWVVAGCASASCQDRLHWSAAAGVLALGSSDVLGELQRRSVAFGGASLDWRAFDAVALRAQLLAHTPFYKGSRLTPLDANAVQLVIGGTWRITPETALEIGVAEDINVDSAPDVTLLVSFRSSFRH